MITLFNNKQDCCGCTACKSICPEQAISMLPDEEGFLYPEINRNLCVECGLCTKVCAFQNGYAISNNYDCPEVYALKHKSDEVRKNSSSGGAFTAISDYILSKKGVIYGVAYDENFNVIHQRAETADERDQFRGSKYVQSDLKEVFSQINEDLKKGRYVLFTGTGCQVAGLNSYLAQTNANTDNLLTVDIICHGTPSPKVFADYISYLEKMNRSKITQYNFRSKVDGWGHIEKAVAVFENGKRDYSSVLSQAHKELFYSHLCLRPACHKCKYTNIRRPADITIGDFWGIENCFPEFKDFLGVSAVLINTGKGKVVFSKLKGSIHSIPSNINDCAARQKNLHSPSPMNPKRDQFWRDYTEYGFDYVIKKYTNYGIMNRIKLRSIAGVIYVLRKLRMLDVAKKILGRA